MKKFYTLLCAMAVTTMAMAQTEEPPYTQVPNGGFEEGWAACVPWTSKGNTTTQGETPFPWCISNTVGTGTLGKTTVGTKVEGYNSSSAIQLEVKEVSGQGIPGYLTLGTAWSTAKGITGGNKDGGTFGGQLSETRPDALTFMYKRTADSNSDGSSVIAYLWKGHWEQKDVPGNIVALGNPTKVTMVNRDRNILGMETSQGGAVTKSDDAELIAVINTAITEAAADWTAYDAEFEYKSTSTPVMMNIIIAAADYFNTAPKVGNVLTIDDVKYLYYSRLNEISVNGTAIEGFNPDTYEYDIDLAMPANDAIAYTRLGQSGTSAVTVNRDEANNTLTLVCTNPQGADKDGLTEHTYTLKFKAAETPVDPADAVTYTGTLTIDLSIAFDDPSQVVDIPNTKLYITPTSADKCTVSLLDLQLEGESLGDIIVPNITITENGGTKAYNGTGTVTLMGGVIVADAEISGTEDATGNINLKIDVKWESETPNIVVTYNGKKDGTSSITAIEFDENAPAEYYDLRGIRHNANALAPGLYIMRQGSKATKVIIK